MATLLESHREDIVIRHDPNGHFTIGASGRLPQLTCLTFAEALHHAGGVAAREQVALWYVGLDERIRQLTDVSALRSLWNQYVELPTLRLTFRQAQRLMALDAEACASALDSLVELMFLEKTSDGQYVKSPAHDTVVVPQSSERQTPISSRPSGNIKRIAIEPLHDRFFADEGDCHLVVEDRQ
jgi:hypothetical protein